MNEINISCYRLFYHIAWAIKDRRELITPQIETPISETIRRETINFKSPIHAINGTGDNVHVAVSILPAVAIAEWVKSVKAVSSHAVNNNFPDLDIRFYWQAGYGVQSLGQLALPDVISYINNQKTHHTKQTGLIPYLEKISD